MTGPSPPLHRPRPVSRVPPVSLRLPEAAQALGVSVKTVRRLIQAGNLAASRLGRVLVVEVRALDDLLRRTRVGGLP